MGARPTASTITGDQLDELYARLARAEAALDRVRAVADELADGCVWTGNEPEAACSVRAAVAGPGRT